MAEHSGQQEEPRRGRDTHFKRQCWAGEMPDTPGRAGL